MKLLNIGEVDFAILDHQVARADLEIVSLGFEQNVLVEKQNYDGPDIYLDHDERDQTTFSYLKQAKKKLSKIERRYLDDIYGVLDGARLGLGRAVLPKHMLTKQNDLRIVNPEVVLKTPVYLHFFKQPYYSKLHTAIVKLFERDIAL